MTQQTAIKLFEDKNSPLKKRLTRGPQPGILTGFS